ncbi:hypothetical protein GCM10009682_25940 [Luedemannella flava]|uniref:Pyrrolo-quinoline quinone repeat domain-containing protein n=1 Tax=Luedemannella flava TaxID=349316 RepID=A0ABP4Y6C2_9ACTN
MSTDLDRLFGKLADRVDAVAPPALDQVRRRARQRQRGTALTVVATCLAVISAAVGMKLLLTPTPSVDPTPPALPPATSFTAFDGSVAPVLRYPGPVRFGATSTIGDRAYAMWMAEDGTEWVGGIDLTTRRPLWPALSLGKFGDTNGMQVSAGAILLLTEQGYDNPLIKDGADTIVVVDPATGKVAWTLPYSFNDCDWAVFADTVVLSCPDKGTVQGLDLRTGEARWSTTGAAVADGVNAVQGLDGFFPRHGWSEEPSTSDQVVLHLTDGQVQVRDAASGAVVKQLSMPVLNGGQEVVVDGVLYQFTGTTSRSIALDGSAAPVDATLPVPAGEARLYPCGAGGRFCAVANVGDERATVTMVDVPAGRTVWQVEVATQARDLIPSAAGLLVPGQRSTVLGLDGSTLAELDGNAMWLESGNLLVLDGKTVVGYQLATREKIELAQLPGARYCSWNSTMLTCPTTEGIGVYRYAG